MSADELQPGHVLTGALAHAVTALQDLSTAVGRCCDAATVRQVARLLDVPPQTVHRWRTEIPGTARLAAALEAARANNLAG